MYGISKQRVMQIEKQALRKMREYLEQWADKDDLSLP